jgi:hypothetical protein
MHFKEMDISFGIHVENDYIKGELKKASSTWLKSMSLMYRSHQTNFAVADIFKLAFHEINTPTNHNFFGVIFFSGFYV